MHCWVGDISQLFFNQTFVLAGFLVCLSARADICYIIFLLYHFPAIPFFSYIVLSAVISFSGYSVFRLWHLPVILFFGYTIFRLCYKSGL
jgi:hypothetical protein